MRISKLRILVVAVFILVFLGLVHLQLIGYRHYQQLSQENRIRLIPIRARRGNIYDREGKLLATSRLSFNVSVVPDDIKDKSEVLEELSSILGVSTEELYKNLKNNALSPYTPTVIAEDIPKEKATTIEENIFRLQPLRIETQPLREYVYPEATAHILGYVSHLDRDELKRLRNYGYQPIDYIGRSGIEETYNSYLKGKNGGYQIEVDNRNRQLDILGHRAPEAGKDLYLNIDVELQNYIYSLIQDKKAAVCVMNPENGAVLAMVNAPSYNPNIFINPGKKESRLIGEIFLSNDYPLVNRSIQSPYPTGSVFKIVTAAGALETGTVNRYTQLKCDGSLKIGRRRFKCWYAPGHGQQTIIEAIKHSCNVYFYQVGLKLGVDNLSAYARKFGFGQKTGVDLPAEAEGLVPDRKWMKKEKNASWYPGNTANFAIGQGDFLATPLQILRMASVIANGGYLVRPQLVFRISDKEVFSERNEKIELNEETLNIIKEGMNQVVSERGTGLRARVKGLSIAGKTATAQTSGGKTHGSFTCFFPVDKPEFAMIVFLEHGGSGGFEAASLSRPIIEFINNKYLNGYQQN